MTKIVDEYIDNLRGIAAGIRAAIPSVQRWRLLARWRMRIAANVLEVLAQSSEDKRPMLVDTYLKRRAAESHEPAV